MHRTILHSDINYCYANIECLFQPALRGRPMAVGGSEAARHGIILAKTPEAAAFGVRTGEALWQARQKCPGLVIVPPHYDRYLEYARRVREIYADYTPQIEPFGMDECWLDITGCGRSGPEAAQELRRRVREELGLTVSVGVADNKIFAKLASDMKKPDAVTVITPENFRERVWPLPAAALLYVGPATQRRLQRCGIRTIGELAQAEPAHLQSLLGKAGLMLHRFANGRDDSPVRYAGEEAVIQSISHGVTCPRDLRSDEDASLVLWILCESVSERLRAQGFLAQTLQLGLRDDQLLCFERQAPLQPPTALARDLHTAAMALLRRSWQWQRPLRSITVHACRLLPEASAAVQTTLFEDEQTRQRRERLERSVYQLRERFGPAAVRRAVTLADPTLTGAGVVQENAVSPVCAFRPA